MNNLDGIDERLRSVRVQIDAYATEFDAVVELSLAVRARMNTPAEAAGSPTAVILRATPAPGSGFDDFEPDTKLFRRSQDFNCWYREN